MLNVTRLWRFFSCGSIYNWVLLLIAPWITRLPAQEAFTFDYSATAGLTGVSYGSAAWGDYDNDGDLDILLTGAGANRKLISNVYRNDSGSFSDITAGLAGVGQVGQSSVAWGDYDNDGDLDILLAGLNGIVNRISKIYRNDGGNFSDIAAGLTGVYRSSVAWGDYDNDGDLDILLTGSDANGKPISNVYRNDSGSFSDIAAGLTGVSNSSVAWGDYDNDGDLDILLTGSHANPNGEPISNVYRNDSGSFSDITAKLTGVYLGSVAWGDYDNDGDLDILLTGLNYITNRISKVYRNDGGNFSDIAAGLTGVSRSSVAWGDYDNDGDLDILLTGPDNNGNPISNVYRNDSPNFSDITAGLTGVSFGSVAWGDYDNDGDLDILLTGLDNNDNSISKIYRNNSPVSNTAPSAPTNLLVAYSDSLFTFSWDAAADTETPPCGLSYNLSIGSGGNEIQFKSPMADINTGYRQVVELGNINQNNTWTFSWGLSEIAPLPFLSFSVQAVDQAFSGSRFAIPDTFFTAGVILAVNDVPADQGGKVILSWRASEFDMDLNFLTAYSIWRAIPLGGIQKPHFSNTVVNAAQSDIANAASPNFEGNLYHTTIINDIQYGWEWLATLPALKLSTYSYTAATLYNQSDLSDGKHFFMVVAHTNDPNIFFSSLPDSGFSLDNLAPQLGN